MQEVGTEQVDEFLQGMGIVLNDGDGVLESNAIGGEITPLQLSAAFATLGNYGEYNQPRAVDYFTTFDGEEVTIDSTSTQAMEDSTAYMVTDMLKDTFTDTSYGLSTNYHTPGLAEAGKSGTTNYTKEEAAKLGVDSSAMPILGCQVIRLITPYPFGLVMITHSLPMKLAILMGQMDTL